MPINLDEQLTRFTIATPVNSAPYRAPIKNHIFNCICPYDCLSSSDDGKPLDSKSKQNSETHIFHSS
jgi:hypothetical protein